MEVAGPQGACWDYRRGANLRLARTHRFGLALPNRWVGDRDRRPGNCGGCPPPSRPRRVAVGLQWCLIRPVRPPRHRLAGRWRPHSAVVDRNVRHRLWGRALGPGLSPTKSSRAPDVGGQMRTLDEGARRLATPEDGPSVAL